MFSVNELLVEFPGRVLLDRIGFVINSRDRIGLVGRNGAGKSTLMKILAGIEKNYSGHLGFPKEKKIGYLVQERSFNSKRTVFDEAETAFEELHKLIKDTETLTQQLTERDDYESEEYLRLSEKLHNLTEQTHLMGGSTSGEETEKVLKGLGFSREEMFRPMSEFSGGWQMRVELARLLLTRPELLLLDEPTNHLDIESIRWLEGYLQNYPGAVMLVSHDRVLLDRVTNRTIEVQQGRIYDYPVAYSGYVTLRQERIEQQSAELKNQQREVAQIEAFIERFRYKATKAKQVQSRIKMLDKIEQISIDETDQSRMVFRFAPAKESGKIVVEAQQVGKSYGEKRVINPIDFIIARGERIAFIGQNGQGKSTLVKMIMGEIPFEGTLKTGHNVMPGYFAQNQTEKLDRNLTVFETLEQIADNETRPRLRNILGSFLFGGEDVDKKVSVLSGGEKTRLALARMLLQPINLLILDEPTNHLDMAARDVLKHALLHFNGTLIIVSHDRDFLSGLSTRIFEFRNHQIRQLDDDITELLERRRQEEESEQQVSAGQERNISHSKQQYLDNKEKEKEKRKIRRQIEDIEHRIEAYEKKLTDIEFQLSHPEIQSTNYDFDALSLNHAEIKQALQREMDEWEQLHQQFNQH